MLETKYKNEEGTGLGPTLDFFNSLGLEFMSEKSMWRKNTVDGTLYPCSLQITPANQNKVKEICAKFELMGTFVAKSILDDRLIELPISQ